MFGRTCRSWSLQQAHDLSDVAQVGAAAATEDIEPRHLVCQRFVLLCQLLRIAGIELWRRLRPGAC
jgi:hypothetical protein